MATEKQRKAMHIFQLVLELILGLFKAHHAKDMNASNPEAENQHIEVL